MRAGASSCDVLAILGNLGHLVVFICNPAEETLSIPSEVFAGMEYLSPLDEIIYSLVDETISSSREAFYLLWKELH